MKVFLSRRLADKSRDKYQALYFRLKAEGFEPWDDQGLLAGQDVERHLLEAVRECAVCVFLLTEESKDNTWCAVELGAFWGAEKKVLVLQESPGLSIEKVAPQFRSFRTTESLEEIVKSLVDMRNHLPATTDDHLLSQVTQGRFLDAMMERLTAASASTVEEIRRISHRTSMLSPFEENSVFGMRYGHFFREKDAIGEAFIQELEKHLPARPDDPKVQLILDAGTTVFPIFKSLVERRSDSRWTSGVEIVTNNLPGVLVLLRDAKTEDHALAFDTHVVGGEPSPDYWALLSENPSTQLNDYLNLPGNRRHIVIGVTTGNYGRDDGLTLLVRGHQHMAFKQALVSHAEIIYSLMPLGKLLPAQSTHEINQKLIPTELEKSIHPRYQELRLTLAGKREVVMVTTERREGDKMYAHYKNVITRVRNTAKNEAASRSDHKMRILEVPFDVRALTNGRIELEEDLEMPHELHRPHLKEWFMWDLASAAAKNGGDLRIN